LNFYCTCSCYL